MRSHKCAYAVQGGFWMLYWTCVYCGDVQCMDRDEWYVRTMTVPTMEPCS